MTEPVLPPAALQDCIAILGKRGSGKSGTARGLVEAELDQGHRTCIIDPKGDWYGLRMLPDGSPSPYAIPIFGGEHGDLQLADTMGAQLGRAIATHDLSCIVDLSTLSIAAQRRFARDFADALFDANRHPITLVVDEADQLAPQRVSSDMATLLHRMERLVRMGRTRGIWMWMISQRAAVLNKNLLSQAETLIAMQVTSPGDRKAMAEWMEAHSPEGARQVLDTLAKLSVGEGWVFSAGADFLERVQFPMFKTADTGRTPRHGETVEAIELPSIDLSAIRAALAQDREGATEAEAPRADVAAGEATRKRDARVRELEDQLAQARAAARRADMLQVLLIDLRERARDLAEAIDTALGVMVAVADEPTQKAPRSRSAPVDKAAEKDRPAREPTPPAAKAGAAAPKLDRVGRDILELLKAFYPDGCTWAELGVRTLRASHGPAWSVATKRLRDGGWIVEEGDMVFASRKTLDDPEIAIGQVLAPSDLRDLWSKRLDRVAGEIIHDLARRAGGAGYADAVGAVLGRVPSGPSWNVAVAKMRRHAIVETEPSGLLRLNPLLLDDAA